MKAYIGREMETALLALSDKMPAILVCGPRQVGKTTLLLNLAESNRQYLSFDDISLRDMARNDPALFIKQFEPPLILDEIQYVPELLPYLKSEIDRLGSNGLYWLTGSQHFHLMKNVSESLAGRVALFSLLGFSHRELTKTTTGNSPFIPHEELLQMSVGCHPSEIFAQIFRGSMPLPNVQQDIPLEVFFNSYLQTYLLRDLRDLSQVADLNKFTRFIRVCAGRTGQLLNYNDLARDTDVSPQTAKNWLSILEASFIVHLVPPYHNNITKRLIKTPKLYFTDTGFCAFLTSWTSPETLMHGAMSGAIFETWVVGEILKSYWNKGRMAPMFFYRDKDGNEIDLLMVKDNQLYPVEIKTAATIRRDWGKSFKQLDKFGQTGLGAVICLTDKPLYINPSAIAIPACGI